MDMPTFPLIVFNKIQHFELQRILIEGQLEIYYIKENM